MTKMPSWQIRAELNSKTRSYKAAVEDAHRIVRWALFKFGNPSVVSCSGGKDSVAMSHLVAQHCKPVVLWNDSGLELPESRGIVEQVCSQLGLILHVATADALAVNLNKGAAAAEMTADGTDNQCIIRPVRALLDKLGASSNFVGLRKDESRRRKKVLGFYGDGYDSKRWGCGVSWPMRAWTGLDSITYIVKNRLPLHPAYLRGPKPDDIRVSWIWDVTRERWGEIEYLRRYYPKMFMRLRGLGLVNGI